MGIVDKSEKMRKVSLGTKPYVFIIESNQWKDEEENRREGFILGEMLSLSQKHFEYRYIRTSKELTSVLEQFKKSRFRYLHIACHGYSEGFAFTLDDIPFDEFINIVSPSLNYRRLFISACSCVNKTLSIPILTNTNCYSVIGPERDIVFSDSAIIWAAFYSLMFKRNRESMSGFEIKSVLSNICSLFNVRFNAYFRLKINPYYKFYVLK